jgi:hypothetical protein
MAVATDEIPRPARRSYFEALMDGLDTVEATVAVVGRDVGAQVADERQILTDIGDDARDDTIVVALDLAGSTAGRTEHLIERPRQVVVASGEPAPLEVTLDIKDGEHHQWLIRLEWPPALPGE